VSIVKLPEAELPVNEIRDEPVVVKRKSGLLCTSMLSGCRLAAGAPAVFARIEMVRVPRGVLLPRVIVRLTGIAALPVAVIWFAGEKLQVAPLGRPSHDNVTGALNGPKAERVKDAEALPPSGIETVAGEGIPSTKSTIFNVPDS